MRNWTKAELDAAHPWPSPDDVDDDVWTWDVTDYGRPVAVGDRERVVSVWHDHLISLAGDDNVSAPVPVAAAVLLAASGNDSLATMAAALIAMSIQLEAEAHTHESHGDRETACHRSGEAVGLRVAATMLQRGRVKP